jgi:2-polyprenyl-3-methyl-5-hydroxy-6-metoxy-1,4-benzoquinol methylase
MDQPGLSDEQHRQALQGLSLINWLSASSSILWPTIRAISRDRLESGNMQPLRVLDIATGGGDVPIRLSKRSQSAGLPIEFAGCDASNFAVDFARTQAVKARANVSFFPVDALKDSLPTDYDMLTCSLFLHHLDSEPAIELLRKMIEAARVGVLVNDLIRCRSGYLLAYAGTRLLSRSRIVHFDGPLSVQGALTMKEASDLADKAGWKNMQIAWRWPFRFLLKGFRN